MPLSFPFFPDFPIAPAVRYAKLMIAIAAEAAPTSNRDIRPGRSGFSRDNPSLFNHRSNRTADNRPPPYSVHMPTINKGKPGVKLEIK
jgi:hypothetical protein